MDGTYHELVHWTGAEHRLARTFGKRFGDEALLSAGFTHFGIVETVTVSSRASSSQPE